MYETLNPLCHVLLALKAVIYACDLHGIMRRDQQHHWKFNF